MGSSFAVPFILSRRRDKVTMNRSVERSALVTVWSGNRFIQVCVIKGNDRFPDDFRDLRHDGIAERSQSVHEAGNPIIASTSEG
jgi:hypothetical protein